MDIKINDIEARALGALVEKELSTPEYYPLSLNALTNACNQKNNRQPVMGLEDSDVVRALDGLNSQGLAEKIYKAGSRVAKYQHTMDAKLSLRRREMAVIAELLLRGPQTPGELRNRSERMYQFKSLEEVDETIHSLTDERPEPLVVLLPRMTGQKEQRYAHILSGMPEISEEAAAPPLEAATRKVQAENERIAALEEEVNRLRDELETLRREFKTFKSQF
jgi:uncharacterized protein YceH (UPF0502 family)